MGREFYVTEKNIKCPTCSGQCRIRGKANRGEWPNKMYLCYTCKGSGKIERQVPLAEAMKYLQEEDDE